MRKNLFLFWALLLCINANAQNKLKENNVWTFGNAGLDFTTGSPVPITTMPYLTNPITGDNLEGTASVCDTGGHLLFYTTGDTLWNRNNQLMANGQGLIAPYSAMST